MKPIYWVPVIAGAFTILGVLIGTILKPVVEQYLERKRRTIKIEVTPPYFFRSPHSDMTFHWRDHKFAQLVNHAFVVQNSTGKSIRKLPLKFEIPARENDENFAYLSVPSDQDGLRISEYKPPHGEMSLTIDFLEEGKSFKGYIISDYARSFSVFTEEDFEIVTEAPSDSTTVLTLRKLVEIAAIGGGVSALAAAFVSRLGM